MSFREFLKEDEKGVYVAVKFDNESNKSLRKIIEDYDIPSTLEDEDFHSTIIYSRKNGNFKVNEKLSEIAVPLKFHIFETQENKRALVVLLDCEYLKERHNELMEKYNLTYDFDEYIPHITLSYDIGDMEVPKDVEFPEKLTIITEYREELDLDKRY